MRIIDLETPITCPRCNGQWKTVFVLQPDADGCDYNTCPLCHALFFRVGRSSRFESPDGRQIIVPGAGLAAV